MGEAASGIEDLIEDVLNRHPNAGNRARAGFIAKELLGQEGLRRLIEYLKARGHKLDHT